MNTLPAGIPAAKPISERQFRWLHATHAFHAGVEFIEKRGDHVAMERWCLDHGFAADAAQAQAQDTALHWYDRQLALRDAHA
jgi:hypothetical protein